MKVPFTLASGGMEIFMKLIIGVTGGTGSGKTTVSTYLKEKGAMIIDADIVAREIVMPGKAALSEIEDSFGNDVILSDGSLNRKKLASIVFTDSKKLNILNSITHKYIIDEINSAVNKKQDGIVVIDAALLFQTELFKLCDKTLSVIADRDVRKKRIISRDGLSEEMAQNRISSQEPDSYYEAKSDYVVVNNGDADSLKFEIDRILKELM